MIILSELYIYTSMKEEIYFSFDKNVPTDFMRDWKDAFSQCLHHHKCAQLLGVACIQKAI